MAIIVTLVSVVNLDKLIVDWEAARCFSSIISEILPSVPAKQELNSIQVVHPWLAVSKKK